MDTMGNYYNFLDRALHEGHVQHNQRTGEDCHVLVGEQLKHDLKDGFPVPTTKKFAFKTMRGEFLGLLRGYTNAADFRALGCKVWDGNANGTQAWLDSPFRKGADDCGQIYGSMWNRWRDSRIARDAAERDFYLGRGYEIEMEGVDGRFAMVRYINQVEEVLKTLLTNPSDRRMIISGWNVGVLDTMCLVPCHMDYRFVAFEDTKELHVVCTIRSWDSFLAYNQQISALFLMVMARLSGYTPRTSTLQITNGHVYGNHREAVELQLSRTPKDCTPRVVLSKNIKPVTSLDEIKGVFERIEPDDIELVDYDSHDAIKAVMAK